MTFLFYQLALDPDHQILVLKELMTLPHVTDLQGLRKLPHLNALISETMRIYPAIPTLGLRQAGPQGLTVAGQYVPPYTNIVAPRYSIGRRKCYQHRRLAHQLLHQLTMLHPSGELLRESNGIHPRTLVLAAGYDQERASLRSIRTRWAKYIPSLGTS